MTYNLLFLLTQKNKATMIKTQGIRTPENVGIGNTTDYEEFTLNQLTEKCY